MKKEEFVFKTSDIMRGSMKQPLNEAAIAVGALLMIEREQPKSLKQLAQSQRIEFQINEFLKQLDFRDNIKECMQSEVGRWINQLSSKEVSDILLCMDKALISNSANDLFDEYIFSSNNGQSTILVTPNSVNHIVENYFIHKDQQTLTFHDGTAGYGFSATSFRKKYSEVELNLQEVSVKAATIMRIRLYLLDINADVAISDVLEEPMFTEQKQMKQFDFVSMSPPWGIKLSEAQVTAMKNDEFNRYVYGIPSRSQGDFAFVSCGLSATKPTGKAAFWLPAGTLFRSGPEQKIRQRLIDLDLVEAIVLLPSNLLAPYSASASVLLLCNKNKTEDHQGKILMVNASELGTSNKKATFINEEKLRLIDDILKQGIEKDSISKFVLNTDIQGAQLSPEVYVYKEEIELEEYGKVKLNTDALNQIKTLPLKDMVTLYRGYNASTKDEDDNGEYSVLKIADVVNGEIKFDELSRYTIKNNAKVDNNRLLNNDILLSIRGTNRKVAIFKSERQDILISQNFVGIRCSESLLPSFLKLYLESPIVQFYFSKHMVGSTVPNLPIKEVNNLPVPVLSLDKQEKIVKLYEEEAANIAKQLQELQSRQKQLKLEAFEQIGLKDTFKIM